MKNKNLMVWVFIVLVLILWIIFPIILKEYIYLENNRGLYGDSYGALNTLFSGLAFALIIYSIMQQNSQLVMQKEELVLQRKELELTRIELNRSASAQESTEKSIRNQAKLMEYSSKLDGLKTLVETYSERSKSPHYSFTEQEKYRRKRVNTENKMEKLIEDLSKIYE